jgi:phage terminase small subunit
MTTASKPKRTLKIRMTPRLQRVCNNYLAGMSMRQALMKEGYSQGYADHMSFKCFKNREVQKYIRDRQKAEADVALADAIYVKKKLMDLAEGNEKFVALNALKQLDAHNKWMTELEARFQEIELKKQLVESELEADETTGDDCIRIKIIE